MRDIKRRIRSAKSIGQITKAMEMVSAAKLRRAQERIFSARPFARKMEEIMMRLLSVAGDWYESPFLEKREVKRVSVAVITADRGLCGAYNAGVIRRAASLIGEQRGREFGVIPVGRKGRDFFRKRNYTLGREFLGLGEEPDVSDARDIAGTMMNAFLNGEVDEVYLVYTEFITTLQQKPVAVKLLPIEVDREAKAGVLGEYLYEPSEDAILDALVPRLLETSVYRALLEAKASEHGARMTAMGSATDNAEEMIGHLTLTFNRARQAAITTEIIEIVSGAEALEG
jgi:F-type H+-transporting ATPase subunit gamma